MTPEQLTTVGVTGLLATIVIAFYTDRIRTKSASDSELARIVLMWQERHADTAADRDGWKAQATQLAPAVTKLADELEERNRLDEERLVAQRT